MMGERPGRRGAAELGRGVAGAGLVLGGGVLSFIGRLSFFFFNRCFCLFLSRIVLALFFLTFSRSLATSERGSPGRAAASCSASAAAKPPSASSVVVPDSLEAIGDETADEEELCLLEEDAVGGALIVL